MGCLQLLLECGAKPSTECLQYAKHHQNLACVEALRRAGVIHDDQFVVEEHWHCTPQEPQEPPPRRQASQLRDSVAFNDSSSQTLRDDIFHAKLLEAALNPVDTISSVLRLKSGEIRSRYIKSILLNTISKAFTTIFHDQVCIHVLRLILISDPDSVRERDENGYLPLHIAVEDGACVEVIDMLLTAYPGAAQQTNKYGRLPLHIACRCRAA